MKTVTFISNQNDDMFPLNTATNFAVLLNQRQKQDTNQHHSLDTRLDFLTLNKFIADINPTTEARLFILSCSLVRETSLFNAKPSNVYKVLCLAPEDYTGLGYSCNFKTVDPLPLVHNEDQIKFNLSSLGWTNKPFDQTLYHTTFPTVVNLIECPVLPIRIDTMSHWYKNQTKIILDSSDKNSLCYRKNNGVDFEIVLDTPINTANETWSMELNAIFIHHRLFHTFPLTVKPEHLSFSLGLLLQKDQTGIATDIQITPINFWSSARTFNSAQDLLQTINFKFKKYSRAYGRAEFTMTRGNKVAWTYRQSDMDEDKWFNFDLKRHVDKNVLDVVLLLPKTGLAQLLGFIRPESESAQDNHDGDNDEDDEDDDNEEEDNEEEDNEDDKHGGNHIVLSLWSRAHLIDGTKGQPFRRQQTSKTYFYKRIVTPHPPFLHPSPTNLQTPLVITCNLVETSLLGLNHLRILRLITTHDNFKYPYICFNEFEQPLAVTLETKTFSRIHIQLCDLKGNLVPISPAGLEALDLNTVVVLTLRKQST